MWLTRQAIGLDTLPSGLPEELEVMDTEEERMREDEDDLEEGIQQTPRRVKENVHSFPLTAENSPRDHGEVEMSHGRGNTSHPHGLSLPIAPSRNVERIGGSGESHCCYGGWGI